MKIWEVTTGGDAKSYEDYNQTMTKRIVNISDNPSPLLILIIILTVACFVYYFYVTMKPDLTGKWIQGDTEYNIAHNVWNDVIQIGSNDGIVKGAAIIYNDGEIKKYGVLETNRIYWNSGDIWDRGIDVL